MAKLKISPYPLPLRAGKELTREEVDEFITLLMDIPLLNVRQMLHIFGYELVIKKKEKE